MLRLAIIALFGWAAYRIVEENRPAVMLLPPPDDAGDDDEKLGQARLAGRQRRRAR